MRNGILKKNGVKAVFFYSLWLLPLFSWVKKDNSFPFTTAFSSPLYFFSASKTITRLRGLRRISVRTANPADSSLWVTALRNDLFDYRAMP
jgi:hypothetical protein